MLVHRMERLAKPAIKDIQAGAIAISAYHSPGTRRNNQDGLAILELGTEHIIGIVTDGHGTLGELLVTAFLNEIESQFLTRLTQQDSDILREAIIASALAVGSRELFGNVEVDRSCGGGSTPGLVLSGFEYRHGQVRFFHAGDSSGILLRQAETSSDQNQLNVAFRTLPHLAISAETGEAAEGVPGRRLDQENYGSFDIEISPTFLWENSTVLLIHSDGLSYRSQSDLLSWIGQQPKAQLIARSISARLESRQKAGWGFDNVSVVVLTMA